MERIFIDSLVSESGNPSVVVLEIPDSAPAYPELELQFSPIVVSGFRLIEEEVLPGGDRKVIQEFSIALA